MPSASTVKVAKEASTEAVEPLRQALVIIEHKIRNLEKRKGRLDGYRDLQKSGKELHNEQLQAVAKYDVVVQTLEFSRDLYKQFLAISTESGKQQKKQARKEALEKTQQEIAKFKEILVIQDVLANMGQDNVREDFLAGRNGAVTLTEEDLQRLDDVFVEVSPKREIEEGMLPFSEQAQKAAEHLVNLVDGKNKDFVGTTYAKLKEQIVAISVCGYFDQSAPGTSPAVAEEVAVIEASAPPEEEAEPEDVEPQVVQSATFQSISVVDVPHVVEAGPAVMPVVETAGQYITQLPITDVISSVMSSVTGSLNFIQESELESPEVNVAQVPAQPVTIPTQTFTNASFSTPVIPTAQPPYPHQHQPPAGYAPIPMPPSQQQQPPPPQPPQQQQLPPQQHMQQPAPPQPQPTQQQVAYSNQPPAQAYPTQPQQPQQMTNQYTPAQQPSQQYSSQPSYQHTVESTDWNESADQSNDWNIPVEQTAAPTPTTTDSWVEQAENEWSDQANDGFVQAGGRGGGGRLGRGGNRNDRGGRGGRDGGYSGQRSNRGNYQNGRGGGGGNYYRNNNEGGGNYYQNGFQSGGYKRTGGNRGGAGGAPRQDRGGPRGGGRGGSNNPRGNRGNRQ